jgi:hypothetical protein
MFPKKVRFAISLNRHIHDEKFYLSFPSNAVIRIDVTPHQPFCLASHYEVFLFGMTAIFCTPFGEKFGTKSTDCVSLMFETTSFGIVSSGMYFFSFFLWLMQAVPSEDQGGGHAVGRPERKGLSLGLSEYTWRAT